MANLRYVTLTGAGEKTSFARMLRASDAYPFVEWGVLYSPNRAGLEARYPSLEWLERFAVKAHRKMNVALHLCGASVKTLFDAAQNPMEMSAEAKRLFALAGRFGRVQLNVRAKEADIEGYRTLIARLSRTEMRTRVILQWNAHNEPVCRKLWAEDAFECLVDSSGGRGVSPAAWPALSSHEVRRLGYAGGLGADNLSEQLPLITAVAGDRAFWVDMEGKLRDDLDRFDLSRCEAVLKLAQAHIAQTWATAGAQHGAGTRKVASMSGLWLDWWVGYATGRSVVIPPVDACRAMTLYRPTGSYEAFTPHTDHRLALQLFMQERVALTPLASGRWQALAADDEGPAMEAADQVLAGLRAIVARHFGARVPCNPARG